MILTWCFKIGNTQIFEGNLWRLQRAVFLIRVGANCVGTKFSAHRREFFCRRENPFRNCPQEMVIIWRQIIFECHLHLKSIQTWESVSSAKLDRILKSGVAPGPGSCSWPKILTRGLAESARTRMASTSWHVSGTYGCMAQKTYTSEISYNCKNLFLL
jgi:hypothetical protein